MCVIMMNPFAMGCHHVYPHSFFQQLYKHRLFLRNPDFPNNELLWRYKNFAGVVEEKTKRVQHEAQLSAEATVGEEDFMENMILF